MKKLVILFAAFIFMSACKDDNKDYLVTIFTPYGDMKLLLYEEAPLHKKNFIELAKAGRYDSTEWHRVIEGFMIQGGDVYSKEEKTETKEDRIPAEIVEGFYHVKGTLAAARQGDQGNPERMSSASQFYIVDGKKFTEEELTTDQVALNRGLSQLMQKPEYDSIREQFIELQRAKKFEEMNQLAFSYVDLVEKEMGISVKKDVDPEFVKRYTENEGSPHLDGQYSIFGKVVEGQEVIDKIAAVETGRGDKPTTPIFIKMEVEQVPKKQITKNYGYEYPESEK